MLKILVYTDGNPETAKALKIGAVLKSRLQVAMDVMTIRSGTHATEKTPLTGVDIPILRDEVISPGMRILVNALKDLTHVNLIHQQSSVKIREISGGYLFVCNSSAGDPVHFLEKFGHIVEELNHEVAENHDNLVIASLKQRGALGSMGIGDSARSLALDLQTSVFFARGGDFKSRFLICADGSPSSKRIFPMLRILSPAIEGFITVAWVRTSKADHKEILAAKRCLDEAQNWLKTCGKEVEILELKGDRPLDVLLQQARDDSVVVMGASLKHDLVRRTLGSLPIRMLAKTKSSVLVIKRPPVGDIPESEFVCKEIE